MFKAANQGSLNPELLKSEDAFQIPNYLPIFEKLEVLKVLRLAKLPKLLQILKIGRIF